jgi:gamma-glutamylcyclotransferase (GGCT)/AIG2-like uncharacterized protein YtfP
VFSIFAKVFMLDLSVLHVLYFSYGSFINSEALRKHCPSAKFVSKAEIPNWEVQFNHMSKTYKAGVTGVEPAPGRTARGVLYDVSMVELEHLDTIEGVPQGVYYRQRVIVVDENGSMLKAETYRTSNPGGP